MAVAAPAPAVLGDYVARTKVATVALVLGGAAFVGILPVSSRCSSPPFPDQTFAVLLVGAALVLGGIASMVVMPPRHRRCSVVLPGPPVGAASHGYILGFIVAAGIVGLAEQIDPHGNAPPVSW